MKIYFNLLISYNFLHGSDLSYRVHKFISMSNFFYSSNETVGGKLDYYLNLIHNPPSEQSADFLKSFLSNRRRYYDHSLSNDDDDDDFSNNSLDILDETVLRLLSEPGSKFSPSILAEILDGPSLFDLASLYGVSNPSSVSQALQRLLEPPPCAPLRNKLTSSLQAVADILAKDIPRGIAEATSGGNKQTAQLIDLAAYMCDVLHGTSRLLSLSPLACMHVFQDAAAIVPDGYKALLPDKATPSQLPLLGAIVASYECSLPVLIFLLGRVKGKTLTHLKLALHSSLLAVNSCIEALYFSELRKIRSSGGGETRTFIASSRAKSCAPAMCSFLSLLSSHKAFDLFSGLSIPVEALVNKQSMSPCFFFQDLSRVFLLQEVIQPLLNASAAASILDDVQRTQIHNLFSQRLDSSNRVHREENVNLRGSFVKPSATDILAVKEILPTATDESILCALSYAGGDIGSAIERLLIDLSGGGSTPNLSSSAVATPAPFLDSSFREKTLALAWRQENEDIEKKKKGERDSLIQDMEKKKKNVERDSFKSSVEQDDVDYAINVESLVDNLLYEDELVDDFDDAGFGLSDGGLVGEEQRGAKVEYTAGKGQQSLYENEEEEEGDDGDDDGEEILDYGLVNYRSEGVTTSKSVGDKGVTSGDHRTPIINGHGPRAAGGLTKRAATRKTQRGNAHRGGRGGMKRMPLPDVGR